MTYWQIGQCILQMVRPHGESGQYGKKIIQNLSSDLTQKYGDGFAPRTVGYFRNFAMRYAASQLNPSLSWSHYRALSGIENRDVRNTLEQRAINEKLTKEQLIQLIAHHRRTHHPGTAEFSLVPRTARPGIYRIVALPHTSNGQYILDLGFNVQHATPLHCPHATPDCYIQQQSSRKYSTVQISPGERYCYPGTIVDIIDGDTVKMQLNLGFNIFITESMRLRGVTAMELNTPEGQKARRALKRLLTGAHTVHAFTWHHDKYGRYITDLIVDEHIYINKKLVESGHARFFKM
jgi:endonuclease YncB( thermonuclease family)